MIFDRIERTSYYRGLSPRIAAALDYCRSTDFAKVAPGRHEIDGPRLSAIVQRYRTKPLSQAVWEAHRKYIDVQYVVDGAERMGYLPLTAGLSVKQPYDPQTDAAFYAAWGDLLEVHAGCFTVFFPHDVHAPSLVATIGEPSEVLKVVVKVAVE